MCSIQIHGTIAVDSSFLPSTYSCMPDTTAPTVPRNPNHSKME